ncbi:MAG: hypothetical protein FWC38_02390 [Proteobacteria bacterium]|nr:hypothetical protein [Pseudomonadota bacterium]
MTPTLLRARRDGLTLTLTDGDQISYHGAVAIVAKWLPELRARKAEIIEALKSEPRFTDWCLHFDQSELEIIIPDGATRVDVEKLYPAALDIEPVERLPSRAATAAERAELWRLVNVVLADAPDEVERAYAAALDDVEAALICYRDLFRHSSKKKPNKTTIFH